MPRPRQFTEARLLRITPELVAAVEEYRFANRIKTESEAIRQLLELGLKSASAPADKAARKTK